MDRHFAPRIYVLHPYVSPRKKGLQKKRHCIITAVSSIYYRFRKKSLDVRLGQFLLILFVAWHVFVLFSLLIAALSP
jgi:hypothetical protein